MPASDLGKDEWVGQLVPLWQALMQKTGTASGGREHGVGQSSGKHSMGTMARLGDVPA